MGANAVKPSFSRGVGLWLTYEGEGLNMATYEDHELIAQASKARTKRIADKRCLVSLSFVALFTVIGTATLLLIFASTPPGCIVGIAGKVLL